MILLRVNDLDLNRKNGRLKIAVIGMSNIGKSYWTERLQDYLKVPGIEIDAQIQNKLAVDTLTDSAKWMGQPGSARYEENARRYLEIENAATLDAIATPGNLIIDTTGSVVHLDAETLAQLKYETLIVYLSADPQSEQTLIERYREVPKPLIWDGLHSDPHAMDRTQDYRRLLRARAKMYAQLADVTIPVSSLTANDGGSDLWQCVKNTPIAAKSAVRGSSLS